MFPKIEPNIKLEPTTKLIGSSIVSLINKFTLLLFELFCIPINKSANKQELKIIEYSNFLINKLILINIYFNFKSNYKLRFSLDHFSSPNT